MPSKLLSVSCQILLLRRRMTLYSLVLDFIGSYERRLAELESLIGAAYQAAICCDETLSQARALVRMLRENLKDTLARNCSLRRRDFDSLMARVFDRVESSQREIERERAQIKAKLATYITGQKEIAAALRHELARSAQEGSSERLDELLDKIKSSYRNEGEETLARLRDFELRVEAFRLEQSVLHSQLRRLLDQGSSISIEDVRRLKTQLLFGTAAPGKEKLASPA